MPKPTALTLAAPFLTDQAAPLLIEPTIFEPVTAIKVLTLLTTPKAIPLTVSLLPITPASTVIFDHAVPSAEVSTVPFAPTAMNVVSP